MSERIDVVDLSHWQEQAIGWKKLRAAGVKAVYHKCSEGLAGLDDRYTIRRKNARAAGMPFGAYHFARPKVSSGHAQAQAFLHAAGVRPGDPRPMLDLEDSGGLNTAQLSAWVSDFVAECRHQLGCPPIIYTRIPLTSTFDCPLWVARYSDSDKPPKLPSPWKMWTLWQFSDGHYGIPDQVAGAGHVDLSTINGDPTRILAALLVPKPGTRGPNIDEAVKATGRAVKASRRGTWRWRTLLAALRRLRAMPVKEKK